MTTHTRQRGDVLFEVLVALAVFAVGAALLLATARETLAALGRAEQRERAIDVARSAIARLEAGIINLQDLRSGGAAGGATVDMGQDLGGDRPGAWKDDQFEIDFRSERTEWTGLSLVELRVREVGSPSDAAPLCILRQLVRLRPESGEPEAPAGSAGGGAA